MKQTIKMLSLWWLPLLLAITACQSTPPMPGQKLGKPYVVDGRTYYPEYDPTYDKIGEASWYGPGFHGKYTASGEVYNQNDLTAAHPTLPLPSLVRVTNLTTGRSAIIRINDRGPFKSNRIIDLSKKSAQTLGIRSIAQVRVQFLKQETEQYLASLQSGGTRKIDMAALNAAAASSRDASIIRSTQPSEQIVENTVSSTHAGQIVSDAAPVMSVRSGDLDQPKATASQKEEAAPASTEKRMASYEPSGKASSNDPSLMHATNKFKEVKLVRTNEVIASAEASEAPEAAPVAFQKPQAPASSNGFYVQVGSFAAEENAHKLLPKLEGIGNVAVGKVEMGAKTWWRVRLGPFANQDDASEALDKVHAAGVPDARVVHL